ncbi:MAG: UvrD-helicase domain-containing protein [Porphyromonas sp.]|uniref:UvrD-helicase domain-containing protein n=1 Tax=Porphyromonas sp. TaxID=1924944 RepID=UPI002A75F314|nr:UvrD-helicase domain-containing protein [Porphyromonas sp.]MDD6928279.1 UvrD-helicase domain-containing protein [Bacteroidales bacterium]MDY3111738.1 UvrD-helicase domain-containing protein [Porphyromonas sp.]
MSTKDETAKRLKVYKASAGAGKTHTMTESFLRHVLKKPKSSYQEVQAVTFTNLATRELKERFFKELHTLATEPQESPFYDSFKDDPQLTENARTALQSILFDYGGLRVKTIDSFFQDIIHALAIELKQRPSTRIELSTDQILSLAVERLFEQPSPTAQKAIQSFLVNRQEKTIYALRKSLKSFAKQLYNEQVQEQAFEGKTLFDPQTYDSFVRAVEKQIVVVQDQIREQVEKARTLVDEDAKLPGGKNSPLTRLTDRTKNEPTVGATNSYITATPWNKYLKNLDVTEALDESYTKGLEIPQLIEIFQTILRLYTELFTLRTAIKNGYELQLLAEIQTNVDKVSEELGITLLDNAKRLIRTLVSGEGSTAFIYERLGTKLTHHMIDEFQDTSRFQYKNFVPLLEEALSSSGEVFIVGDVKQSIYRFRYSDPMLLQEDLGKDFGDNLNAENLPKNWRSAPAIVSFNNRFFSLLPTASELRLEDSNENPDESPDEDLNLIQRVYKPKEVHQDVPDSNMTKVGGVFIHQWEKMPETPPPTAADEENASAETPPPDPLQTKINYLLYRIIPSIRARGYKLSDIAILTPNNDTLQRIAQAIIQYNKVREKEGNEHLQPLAFVSREMLSLDANPLYRLIVEIMQSVLVNAGASEELYSKSFEHRLAVTHYAELARGLSDSPALDLARCYQEGLSASLYELTLLIVEELRPLITSADQPYIDALLDTVQDYSQDNYVDLQGFLEWLETHTPRLSLETQDALQLLTIHSAKGLGFPVVCLLEYKMRLLEHTDTIWCRDEETMAKLHKLLGESVEIPALLPISPTKEARSTLFRKQIMGEEQLALLDRINTLYVAMTRAKNEMHLILSEDKGQSGTSINFERLISELVNEVQKPDPEKLGLLSRETIDLQCSEDKVSPSEDEEINQRIFYYQTDYYQTDPTTASPKPTTDSGDASRLAHIPGRAQTGALAQLRVRRSQSVAYQTQDAVRNGLFLHALLSEIDYLDHDELLKLLDMKCLQGLIPQEQRDTLAKLLEQALTDPMIAEYYDRSSGWQVINERSIVRLSQDADETRQARIERPDRILYDDTEQQAVIIDYKSGDEAQQHTSRHKHQLRSYRKALLESGFQTVRAYLLYLSAEGHQVVEVD